MRAFKPYVGMPVVVESGNWNGATEHAGIVTRVWTDGVLQRDGENTATVTVNLTMFPDAHQPMPVHSVDLYGCRDAAQRWGSFGHRCWPAVPEVVS